MGVGAKTLTPIKFNEQPQEQINNVQENNDNFTQNLTLPSNLTWQFETLQPVINYHGHNWAYGTQNGTTDQFSYVTQMYNESTKLNYDEQNTDEEDWGYTTRTLWEEGQDTRYRNGITWYKMEVIQITPSYNISNISMTVNSRFTLQYFQIAAETTFKIYTQCYIIRETNETITTYTSNSGHINEVQLELTNNYQNKAEFYQEEYEITLDRGDRMSNYHETTFNFPIIKGQTNTIIVGFGFLPQNNQDSTTMFWYQPEADQNNGRLTTPISTSLTNISGIWYPNAEDVTQEVVNIPGLMWEILSMPWAFISTAFNLTLFPGTPYSVNISMLFSIILATAFFVVILKKVLGK